MLRLLRRIALIDLGVFVTVGLVCWLMGWRTASQYGNGLVAAGVLVVAAGLLSSVGRMPGGTYARVAGESVGLSGLDGYREQLRRDMTGLISFLFLAIAVGVLPIAFGLLLQAAFP